MITITDAIKSRIITQINSGLMGILINYPDLGIDDTPTQQELTLRYGLLMSEVGVREISANGGYARRTLGTITPVIDNHVYSFTLSSSFLPVGGNYSEATHIIYATNALSTRGNTQGTVILVEPILNAPVIITNGVTYTHSTEIQLA
jgi:hypothetical protein